MTSWHSVFLLSLVIRVADLRWWDRVQGHVAVCLLTSVAGVKTSDLIALARTGLITKVYLTQFCQAYKVCIHTQTKGI